MATRSLNKVQLIGNLTRDPELRYTSGGTSVATFGVATNRTYTDSSNNVVESAEFTNVVAWAKLAEICSQLLNKGSKVFIEGRLQTSSWTDQESGKQMRRTEVVATDMIVLSSSGGHRSGSNSDQNEENAADIPSSKPEGDMNQDVDFNNLDLGDEVDSSSSSDDNSGDSSDSSDNDKKKEESSETPF